MSPALWIRWRRDGRATWSVAHLAAVATHRTEAMLGGAVRLVCGRTSPEGMAAEHEITAAGLTVRPCRPCLIRWTP